MGLSLAGFPSLADRLRSSWSSMLMTTFWVYKSSYDGPFVVQASRWCPPARPAAAPEPAPAARSLLHGSQREKNRALRTSPSLDKNTSMMISYPSWSALRTFILSSNMCCQEFLHQLAGLGNLWISSGKSYIGPWQHPPQTLKIRGSTRDANALRLK